MTNQLNWFEQLVHQLYSHPNSKDAAGLVIFSLCQMVCNKDEDIDNRLEAAKYLAGLAQYLPSPTFTSPKGGA